MTKNRLEAAERAAAVQAGDASKVARIDAREQIRRKWKAYHRSTRKECARLLKPTEVVKVVTSP